MGMNVATLMVTQQTMCLQTFAGARQQKTKLTALCMAPAIAANNVQQPS